MYHFKIDVTLIGIVYLFKIVWNLQVWLNYKLRHWVGFYFFIKKIIM